ncbi:MAG: ZIP family metal transporter [Endomicrobium sp.]|jgi:ZIP family zinc transporter/zinc and cadmium transporter|nr:ZIP family metal transporter [Endomicrobium sp.]
MGIIYSLIATSAAMIGVILVLTFHEWSKKNSFLIINFSAGVMLTLAFTHLIPESLNINTTNSTKIMTYVLLGFLAMFFLQFVILFHPCHDDKCSKHLGLTSIIGFSLHSITDGLIIAVGFEANTSIGILTTLAILLHKLPDGVTVSGILLHNGASKKKILNFSFLTTCFTPIGTLLGTFLFKNIPMNALSALLSMTAGTFIFLSASDLIPETHKCKNRLTSFMLFAGVIIILLLEHIM